jgi:hypothetical protein
MFRTTIFSLWGFCLSFSDLRTWRLLREVDGDPPVLQLLPDVVEKEEYFQVAKMLAKITPIARSLIYRMSGINFRVPDLP